MKLALVLAFSFLFRAGGATVINPNLPEVEASWVYFEDLRKIQRDDVIFYLSYTPNGPPWYMAWVFDIDVDKGMITVARPVGRGVSIFESVEEKRILGVARREKRI